MKRFDFGTCVKRIQKIFKKQIGNWQKSGGIGKTNLFGLFWLFFFFKQKQISALTKSMRGGGVCVTDKKKVWTFFFLLSRFWMEERVLSWSSYGWSANFYRTRYWTNGSFYTGRRPGPPPPPHLPPPSYRDTVGGGERHTHTRRWCRW